MRPTRYSLRHGTLHVEQASKRHTSTWALGATAHAGPARVESSALEVAGGTRLRVRVVPDAGRLTLRRVELRLSGAPAPAARVLANGYQSWTETRERGAHERLPPLMPPLGWLLGPFGDYRFAPYAFRRGTSHGFTYAYLREGDHVFLVGALSEDGGYLRIDVDAAGGSIRLAADVDGCEIDAPMEALDVFIAEGTDDTVFDAWFAARGDAPVHKPTLSGWTSWYLHFTQVTEADVQGVLRGAARLGAPLDVVQLDDGYQTAVGDHLDVDRAKFPRGLSPVAAEIAAAGHAPGLWLAPFVCTTPSRLFKEHAELLERDARGRLFRTGYNPWWKGHFYALDVEHPESRDLVEQTLADAMAMGFSFLKLDFLFAAALQHRRNRPRGRRMRDTMRWLRERTQGATVLGCGVPLGAALGLVDYCRIGSDVSPRWEDKLLARLNYRERPSTRNSLASTVGRRHLHGRGFANDADVFFLRRGNIEMGPEERRALFVVNATFSALLFTSDALEGYGPEERAAFTSLFPVMERRLLRVQERDLTVDADVEVRGRSYRLLANLGDRPATFALPQGPCFELERGLFAGDVLTLPPHRAVLVHAVHGAQGASAASVIVAGSPHVFPGSDCTLEETADGWVLTWSTPAPGEVTLLVTSDVHSVRINGLERTVETTAAGRVVRVRASPPPV